MKFHALLELEQFVLEKLSPGSTPCLNTEAEECKRLSLQVEKDVKTTFGLIGFSTVSNEVWSRHLDLLYRQCRNLSDKLHAFGTGVGLQGQLREAVQAALIDLLDYLLESHDDLLSPSLPAATLHLSAAAAGMEAELGGMVSLMKQYHVEPALQAIIVSKISKLKDSKKSNWVHIRHLEKIQHFIRREFTGRFNNANAQLCEFLQRSNFNTESFLIYCKSELDKLIAMQQGPVEAYSKLCELEKIYRTAYYKKNALPYDAKLPQVKVVLLEHVRAELDCLRKKERGLAKPVIVLNAVPAASAGQASADVAEKLSLSMSVDVLVCFFRLLICIGIVTNPSKASVLRFLSKHVETPGAADRDISLKSLDNKYNQLEKSTRMTTRGILVKMLQKLDEECA